MAGASHPEREVTETHGMKLWHRPVIAPLVLQVGSSKDIFDTELIARAEWSGLAIRELPIRTEELRHSRSGIFRRDPPHNALVWFRCDIACVRCTCVDQAGLARVPNADSSGPRHKAGLKRRSSESAATTHSLAFPRAILLGRLLVWRADPRLLARGSSPRYPSLPTGTLRQRTDTSVLPPEDVRSKPLLTAQYFGRSYEQPRQTGHSTFSEMRNQ